MKKILKNILLIIMIIWIGFELLNLGTFIFYKIKPQTETYGFPSPQHLYRPWIVQVAYYIFPLLDQNSCRNCEYKPVIYLYPTSIEKVKVELSYNGTLIADYPEYNYSIKGWEVTAYPDGKIVDSDGKEYSYLFWEGKPREEINWDLSTGFVVKGEDTREFLQEILPKMGLTPEEYNEFIVYWYPQMQNNKYNLIHFAGKEYTDIALLNITPKPDSILRVFMVFKPLNKSIEIEPQKIEPFTRDGFTVIEWGGTELK